MYFIDSHTHIYLPEFQDDRPAMMERARNAGVELFILPAIDAATHGSMVEMEQAFPGCHALMGLHPCSVKQDLEWELALIRDYLRKRKFLAVGEIGLDFYWDKTFVKEQYEAFHRQIGLALEQDLPIVIHSRNAIDECIAVVEQYPGLRGVFHCFSGNYAQAVRILDTGFQLGIGGVVTFKNSGLDAVMAKTGIEAVILETDAPYLAPVPYRGKRNEPSYIPLIAARLSEIVQRPVEEIAELTTENTRKLFRLP